MAWNSTSEKTKRTAPGKVVEMRSSGKGPSETAGEEKPKDESAREKGKDLHSGMELLELDFLLSIVENTKGDDENDVTMRKLNYGKDIQCETMKELTTRTAHKSKRKS